MLSAMNETTSRVFLFYEIYSVQSRSVTLETQKKIEKRTKQKEKKKKGYCVTLHPGSYNLIIQFSRDFERRQSSWTYNHGPVGPLSRSKLRNLLSCIFCRHKNDDELYFEKMRAPQLVGT
jgi:hypothetical protein